MSQQIIFSVNIVDHDHGAWVTRLVDSLKAQSFTEYEINIYDGTKNNIGFWAGQEELLSQSTGKYIVCASDVILDKNFLMTAKKTLDSLDRVGALQAKVLQSDGKTIDTTGFFLARSRRVTNRGQGQSDDNQFSEGEIFCVEGAVPIFRKISLEDVVVKNDPTTSRKTYLIDPHFRIGPLGYGDDLDLAWRMKNRGWVQWYNPHIIAYHDRSTTRSIAQHWYDVISRRKLRAQIPLIKRQLDWVNIRLSIIKNDSVLSLLRDAPWWLTRELGVFLYMLFFEPKVLLALPHFLHLVPTMIRRRYVVKYNQ